MPPGLLRHVVGGYLAQLGWISYLSIAYRLSYTKRSGYKDILIVNTRTWLLLLEENFAVGLFCLDVKGAFDRVACERLTAKLA